MWNKIKENFKLIGSVILAILGAVFFLFGKKRGTQKVLDAGKEIGKSEQKDEDRKEVIEKAEEQIERNEEVIERSREAIARARELRNENTD